MATYTTNKGYAEPQNAGDVGVWGTLLNQNMSILDNNLAGVGQQDCTGGSNVTIAQGSAQSQCLVQMLTGTITAHISYQLPQVGGFYIIYNTTSGSFTVTVQTSAVGSSGVTVPQGGTSFVFSDGTDVRLCTNAADIMEIVGLSATSVAVSVFSYGTALAQLFSGSGSPEGVIAAPVGSLYTSTLPSPPAAAVLYVKATGSGNTGWVAK